jgi:hypothetical protein
METNRITAAPAVAGEVTTFYAYDGAGARSRALVHAAWLLSGRAHAKTPVLMIDWDLEGPRPAPLFPRRRAGRTPGRARTVRSLPRSPAGARARAVRRNPRAGRARARQRSTGTDYIERVDDSRPLYLMRAGRFDDSYGERADRLDWDALFCACPALFRSFAAHLTRRFAHVLVDCRSGRSAATSVCTRFTARQDGRRVHPGTAQPGRPAAASCGARSTTAAATRTSSARCWSIRCRAPPTAGEGGWLAHGDAPRPRRSPATRPARNAAGRVLRPGRASCSTATSTKSSCPRPAVGEARAGGGRGRARPAGPGAQHRTLLEWMDPAISRGGRWPRCAWCRPSRRCANVPATPRRRRWRANWRGWAALPGTAGRRAGGRAPHRAARDRAGRGPARDGRGQAARGAAPARRTAAGRAGRQAVAPSGTDRQQQPPRGARVWRMRRRPSVAHPLPARRRGSSRSTCRGDKDALLAFTLDEVSSR